MPLRDCRSDEGAMTRDGDRLPRSKLTRVLRLGRLRNTTQGYLAFVKFRRLFTGVTAGFLLDDIAMPFVLQHLLESHSVF